MNSEEAYETNQWQSSLLYYSIHAPKTGAVVFLRIPTRKAPRFLPPEKIFNVPFKNPSMGTQGGAYYSIDDILAEAEVIPAKFRIDGIDLGYLDEQTQSMDLKKGSRVPLPFWLASALAKRGMVEVDIARTPFGRPRFRTDLLADPVAFDLRDRNPYFYTLGLKLALLDRNEQISDLLFKSLAERYQEILKRSPTFRGADFKEFTSRLTHIEAQLLNDKWQSEMDYKAWKNGHSNKITRASPTKRQRLV
eukprot:g70665.t1